MFKRTRFFGKDGFVILVIHRQESVPHVLEKTLIGEKSGAAGRNRTDDLFITNELLYP